MAFDLNSYYSWWMLDILEKNRIKFSYFVNLFHFNIQSKKSISLFVLTLHHVFAIIWRIWYKNKFQVLGNHRMTVESRWKYLCFLMIPLSLLPTRIHLVCWSKLVLLHPKNRICSISLLVSVGLLFHYIHKCFFAWWVSVSIISLWDNAAQTFTFIFKQSY